MIDYYNERTKRIKKKSEKSIDCVTMCCYLTTQEPKVSLFMLSSARPTQTPACFRAEAVERPAASVATAPAAAPALECVCDVTLAVHGGSSPEGWGWW